MYDTLVLTRAARNTHNTRYIILIYVHTVCLYAPVVQEDFRAKGFLLGEASEIHVLADVLKARKKCAYTLLSKRAG